jgi:hypothetical protein
VLLVALALWHLRAALAAALPRAPRAGRSSPWWAPRPRVILAVNWRTYFVDYAPRYRHSPAVEIAGFINRHGRGRTTYMIGGAPAFFIRHGTISFLTWGKETRDITDLDAFLQTGRFDPQRSAFVIMLRSASSTGSAGGPGRCDCRRIAARAATSPSSAPCRPSPETPDPAAASRRPPT